MKVYAITTDTMALAVTPVGNRYSRNAQRVRIKVYTDEGVFIFDIYVGFMSNFRSGGLLVDPFIDQVGDEKKALCYLVHDAIYTPCAALGMEHPISRIRGDQLLRAALLYAGMHNLKAALVYNSVRLFGHSAYWEDDELTAENSRLFNFRWEAA